MANDTQFNYRDATGRARTAKSSAAVPGQAGYESAALSPDGTRTAQGDAANPFRGYVGPDGGTFGGYDSIVNPTTGKTQKQFDETVAANRAAAQARPVDWSQWSKRPTGPLQGQKGYKPPPLPAGPQDFTAMDAMTQRLGAGDTNFSNDELASLADPTANPFRSVADMVRMGYDRQGNRVAEGTDYYGKLVAAGEMDAAGADRLRARAANVAKYGNPDGPVAQAEEAPQAPADPWGQFEAATAANNVIKPGQDRLSPRTPRMQQPDPFDLFQPGITPAQNPGAQAGIQATPAAIQPATFGAQQQSALGSPDQLGPTDTNPAGLPTRPPSDATPNGVSFVPGGIQPMTFGRREIPWATPNAGPPAGLPAAPAMTPPAGGFGGAFGSPMKGGMGAGLRRIGQRLMPGLKRPRALRPIRPQGGAAQTGLTPQTPQF